MKYRKFELGYVLKVYYARKLCASYSFVDNYQLRMHNLCNIHTFFPSELGSEDFISFFTESGSFQIQILLVRIASFLTGNNLRWRESRFVGQTEITWKVRVNDFHYSTPANTKIDAGFLVDVGTEKVVQPSLLCGSSGKQPTQRSLCISYAVSHHVRPSNCRYKLKLVENTMENLYEKIHAT